MSKVRNVKKEEQFDYRTAIEKENAKYEEAEKTKPVKKLINVPETIFFKKKVTVPKKIATFTQEEMQLKGEVLLNRLKDSVNFEGLDLKFKATNSWYCGYKSGSKCVFCVKYSPKDVLKVEVIISKQQFDDLGTEGSYFDNRYADYLYDEKEFEKFSKIVQVAVDNFKAKLPKVQVKKKVEAEKEEILNIDAIPENADWTKVVKKKRSPAPISAVTHGKRHI